jgi:hypothetical protein
MIKIFHHLTHELRYFLIWKSHDESNNLRAMSSLVG